MTLSPLSVLPPEIHDVGLVLHDEHGRVVDANVIAANILGIDREELIGIDAGTPYWRLVDGVHAAAGDRFRPPLPANHHNGDVIAIHTRSRGVRQLKVSVQPYAFAGRDGAMVCLVDLTDVWRRCRHCAPADDASRDARHMAEALRDGVRRDEIEIALQPQIRIGTGEVAGFEALARWRWQERDVPPAQFIAIAEQTDLMPDLGRNVLRRALFARRIMVQAGYDPGGIAINASAAELNQSDYANVVGRLLDRQGVSPHHLEIEITENVLLDRAAAPLMRTLDALHALGVRIALDDFGTGYASLKHLKQFRINRLKIDRSFVTGIPGDADDTVIVRALIDLAHDLDMDVVAEGIETTEQLAFLAEHRCDVGQGFLFGRPASLGQTHTFLASQIHQRQDAG